MPSPIFPDAWVVECAGCRCVITCFALDPQSEHMNKSTAPPATSAQVACPCCLGTYRYGEKDIRRGRIQPNPACRRNRSADLPAKPANSGAGLTASSRAKLGASPGTEPASKLDGALLVGACLIAAVRMGSAEVRPSPKLTVTVTDAVRLARAVLAEMQRS